MLDLNVWFDEVKNIWKMAVYGVGSNGETNYDNYVRIEATPERVARYLEISEDSDWWTSSTDPDFLYITTGERITFA